MFAVATVGNLEIHAERSLPEPRVSAQCRVEVGVVANVNRVDMGERLAEPRRVGQRRPQLGHRHRHDRSARHDHRELTETPRGNPSDALRSNSYTRSAGLCVSYTMCAPSGSASWIALQIVDSGAPPPSPIPFAPFGVNGDGHSTWSYLIIGTSSDV